MAAKRTMSQILLGSYTNLVSVVLSLWPNFHRKHKAKAMRERSFSMENSLCASRERSLPHSIVLMREICRA